MKTVEFFIRQAIGAGQGYFVAHDAPGLDALVELENEGRYTLRLTIGRFNNSSITQDVGPEQKFALESSGIQTVGIVVLPRDPEQDASFDMLDPELHDFGNDLAHHHPVGRGRLVIVPNFSVPRQ